MADSYEIIDGHNNFKLLKWTDSSNIIRYIGISLLNKDYQNFLSWNDEQQEPLELPGDWPTNE